MPAHGPDWLYWAVGIDTLQALSLILGCLKSGEEFDLGSNF